MRATTENTITNPKHDNNKEKEEETTEKSSEKELEDDSEYEGFERVEIADIVDREHKKEDHKKKEDIIDNKKLDDKTTAEVEEDESYEDYVDTTPEALSTKGENKDLNNDRPGTESVFLNFPLLYSIYI